MWNRVAYVAVVLALCTTTAVAGSGVGEARAVVDVATASGGVGERPLAAGSVVFLGDRVVTDGEGEAQLLFDDGTRMVIGPNSSMVIDEFALGTQATESRFSVRAQDGAFRFISGDAPREAYLISTPAAAIGVRGTAFDLNVSGSGTDLLLLDPGRPGGGAVICAPGADCEKAEAVCDLVSAGRGEGVAVADDATRAAKLRDRFPLLASRERLGAAFRADDETVETCLALLGTQRASGPGAPAPLPGPGLPEIAGPAGLAVLGALFGFLAGGDDAGATTTTTTTTTTTATGTE